MYSLVSFIDSNTLFIGVMLLSRIIEGVMAEFAV